MALLEDTKRPDREYDEDRAQNAGRGAMRELDPGFGVFDDRAAGVGNHARAAMRPTRAAAIARTRDTHIRAPQNHKDVVGEQAPGEFGKTRLSHGDQSTFSGSATVSKITTVRCRTY